MECRPAPQHLKQSRISSARWTGCRPISERARSTISRQQAMASSVIVDASFLVTLLNRRDSNHRWAEDQAAQSPPPWQTCEAVLSEAFHLLGARGAPALA